MDKRIGWTRAMAHKAMDVYLNDHLGGATLGTDLAGQIADHAEGTPLAGVMNTLHVQIEEDRETLVALMESTRAAGRGHARAERRTELTAVDAAQRIVVQQAQPPRASDRYMRRPNHRGGCLLQHMRMIVPALAVTAAVALPAAAAAEDGVSVCNEAENSPRGGYVVTEGPVDPNPPAFLRGSQMRVGNGHGAGLEHAAERSPALRACGLEDDEGGGPILT
ncbi:MAG: hypothetical protein ACRDK0_01805 [Solirubrobacteraceae bacterium]